MSPAGIFLFPIAPRSDIVTLRMTIDYLLLISLGMILTKAEELVINI